MSLFFYNSKLYMLNCVALFILISLVLAVITGFIFLGF
jgi:hypothetical protein